MNIKKVISSIGIGAGAIILGLGIQYALADWNQAPPNPPQNNVAAPINVGTVSQAKNAGLALGTTTPPTGNILADIEGGLFSQSILTQGFTLSDANSSSAKKGCTVGSPGCENGSVLTNDGSGLASWLTPSTAYGSGGYDLAVTEMYIHKLDNSVNMVPAECTINILNGSVICIQLSSSNFTPFGGSISVTLFSATTAGLYGLSCSDVVSVDILDTFHPSNPLGCCRINKNDGTSSCSAISYTQH
jgi:hypothetical protein